MNFSTPLPRASQPRYAEGSAMRSNRDADSNAKQWQKNRAVGKQNDATTRVLAKMQQDIGRIRRSRAGGGSGAGIVKQFTLAQPTIQHPDVISASSGKLVTTSGEVQLPPLLRNTVASRKISSPTPNDESNTIVVNYAYSGGSQFRNASATGFTTEVQTIVPNYLPGDTILAVQDQFGNWTDLNVDSRMWCAYPVQPQPV